MFAVVDGRFDFRPLKELLKSFMSCITGIACSDFQPIGSMKASRSPATWIWMRVLVRSIGIRSFSILPLTREVKAPRSLQKCNLSKSEAKAGTLLPSASSTDTDSSLALRLQFTDEVSALINYSDGRAILSLKEIEKLLQLPVRFILPRDEPVIATAVVRGAAVDPRSKFGAQIEAIAKTISEAPAGKPLRATPGRRFLEFFSVSPDRDRDRWRD
jgi:hypothetical protein